MLAKKFRSSRRTHRGPPTELEGKELQMQKCAISGMQGDPGKSFSLLLSSSVRFVCQFSEGIFRSAFMLGCRWLCLAAVGGREWLRQYVKCTARPNPQWAFIDVLHSSPGSDFCIHPPLARERVFALGITEAGVNLANAL